ncbi:MAG: tetratricopeptide repeat protein, partial [Caulobacterales bacterium]|nr:tetratricopeptide repeat protein [Caulobacterales bacterium]
MPHALADSRRAARTAFHRADHAKLERACAAILADAPEDAEARRLLGRAALRDLRPHDAAAFFRQAAARAPNEPGTWTDLARALLELGRAEEAEAHLDAAATRGVASAGLLTLLGDVRARLSRAEAAREAYETALEDAPYHGEAFRGLALAGGLGPGEPARSRAQQLTRDPDRPARAAAMAGYALAEAALREGDEDGFFAWL